MATSTTFDASPKPKISMTNGRIALLGIGYVAEIIGFSAALAQRDSPIASPRVRAGTPPTRNPSRTRFRLAPACSRSSPEAIRPAKVPTIEEGAGKKARRGTRILTSPSQSAMSSKGETIAISCSPAASLRAEGGMGVRGTSRSDAWDIRGGLLRFCLQHFLAKQSPQMVDESPVRRVGPHLVGLAGARKRNLHHSLDPSRGGRHNEDAVCEHDGLVAAVRDEDHRLAVLVPDLDEFCLQQDACLFVKLAERLVHEQDLGVCGKRAGDAGPLFHPSGELEWICAREPGEADFLKGAADCARDDGPRHALDGQPVADVLLNSHPREDRIFLEHHRCLRPGAVGPRDGEL